MSATLSVALPRGAATTPPNAPAAPEPAPRFPLLDSVRAIAALTVIAYHTTWGGLRLDPAVSPLGERLNVVAVPMFMALSGFLLYRPFLAARRWNTETPSLRRYALGRVLRLAPGYWAALLILAVATQLHGDVLGSRFWVYFGFAQTYADWDGLQGLTHAWTLCLEASFYVFLALWVLGVRRRRLRPRQELCVLALLSAASLALQYAYYATAGRWGNLDLTLPAMLFMFCGGMALAVISVAHEGRERRSRVLRLGMRHPTSCWLLAGALYLVLCYGTGLPPRGSAIGDYSAAGWLLEQALGAAVALLVLLPATLVHNSGGLPGRVLESPVLAYVGKVSYGVYLWHLAVLSWVEAVFPLQRTWDSVLLNLALVAAGSTLVATLSWIIVEKPFLQLKGRGTPAPQPDRGGDGEQREDHRADAERAPARPLGVAWQDYFWDGGVGGHQHGRAGGGAGLGSSDDLRGAGALPAVQVDQRGGGAGGQQQVAVPHPGRDQFARAGAEQPLPRAGEEAPPALGEPTRHHGHPGHLALDDA